MNVKSPFGRLTQVGLRGYWDDEARDFTPWLAQEENIRLLGDAIGLSLEPVGLERSVGPFRADILAREEGTEDYVLIENQLERTNHDHLGKLITYASGLGAKAVVWVAREITEEHRKALDWLNEMTVESLTFFGVEIELWQIGDSQAAPKFSVVVQPNEWARASREGTEQPTETRLLQYTFWREFVEFAREKKTFLQLRQPRPQHWYAITIGRSGFHLSLTINTRRQRVGCELYIRHRDAKRAFSLLAADRTEIEAELNSSLEWRELSHRRASRIVEYRQASPEARREWPALFSWLLDRAEAFHRAFAPRVRALDLPEAESEEVEEEDLN